MTASRIPAASVACVAALALVSGCSSAGSGDSGRSTTQAAPAAASDLQDDYQKVIKDVLPSVVQIDASEGLGSGVVYDDKGHIVTNAHVVGKEKRFKVTTATGEQVLTADLVASYPEQDLAVIKLSDVPDGLK